ncbi:8716_t:CDS:2, partial [Acaulospora morrowiae]
KSDEKPSPPPFEDIKNPNEHHLIWKGAQSFDYYLESSNPMIFSNVIKELGSNFEKQNSKSIPKIEFIAKSDLGSPLKKERVTKKRLDKLRERIERGEENEFYEGVELYYDIFINFYESFKVLSATSGVNGEWKNSNITLISQENSTLVEVCEFKIDWSDDLEGVISKRNANNETSLNGEYNVVAYVKGSIDYGFMFYEKEDGGGKLFAETNQTEIGWKMDRRNIYVYEDSPIPAILPALYIMYYDFFQRMSL